MESFFNKSGDIITLGVYGLAGATINLLLYLGAGKPINKPLVYATLLSGVTLAMTGSAIVGSMLGIDVTKSGAMGLCALLAGMIGIKVATKVTNMELPLGK